MSHTRIPMFWLPLVTVDIVGVREGESKTCFQASAYDEIVSSPRPDKPIEVCDVDGLMMAVQEWYPGEYWGAPMFPTPNVTGPVYHVRTGYYEGSSAVSPQQTQAAQPRAATPSPSLTIAQCAAAGCKACVSELASAAPVTAAKTALSVRAHQGSAHRHTTGQDAQTPTVGECAAKGCDDCGALAPHQGSASSVVARDGADVLADAINALQGPAPSDGAHQGPPGTRRGSPLPGTRFFRS